ncbi:hypothetical protein CSX04_00174 [Burkholderia cepacia]|nr:hypothetical protein CSX04_00174 [Burkholderia cepacia]
MQRKMLDAAARCFAGAALATAACAVSAGTLTIATLNNPDMIELKKLSPASRRRTRTSS